MEELTEALEAERMIQEREREVAEQKLEAPWRKRKVFSRGQDNQDASVQSLTMRSIMTVELTNAWPRQTVAMATWISDQTSSPRPSRAFASALRAISVLERFTEYCEWVSGLTGQWVNGSVGERLSG
ncbi:uncharacterized protein LOC110884648 [Helianthus annuus]|uniref:uncharacterized protein LOC110884648 n=1 Tax=Helianthus annuus TaxID=4232 RepID=UPI0016532C0B|nr:uncharacterized protein LOC110884648 [Helianthus annuus]